MARSHGKTGAVYVSPSGTGVAVSIGNLSKWSLDRSTDVVPTTSFGDTNKTYVQGLPDLKGSLSGFWDSATDPLYLAGLSPDGVKMYLYPSSVTPTVYDYGPAWLNTSIDVDVNGAVTISGTFVANGSWGHKP
jgi:hypothetical protein